MKYTNLKRMMTFIGFHHYQIFSTMPLWIIGPFLRSYYRNVWTDLPQDVNILFIHIPKNAGTSVTSALYGKQFGHRPASLYLASDRNRFKNISSFAIIRNPYDRFCSTFYHFLNSPYASSSELQIGKSFFRRFSTPTDLANALKASKRLLSDYMSLVHARPQVDWLRVEEKIVVQHLFPFERMDLVELFLRKSLDTPHFSLPHVNSSKTAFSWENELNCSAKQIVKHLYREDMKLWESLI